MPYRRDFDEEPLPPPFRPPGGPTDTTLTPSGFVRDAAGLTVAGLVLIGVAISVTAAFVIGGPILLLRSAVRRVTG